MVITAQRYQLGAQYFTESLGATSLDMVYIPGGRFLMGSSETEEGHEENQGPQHAVTVPPFFMGKYPITQGQWRAVAKMDVVNKKLKDNPSKSKGNDDLPVEQVSWHDAVEFCDRLSLHTKREYRLPSEAEWEYACRAGTTTPFHFGETISTDTKSAN
jgi:formylglycine-generating enzyme required for sulfatase activity